MSLLRPGPAFQAGPGPISKSRSTARRAVAAAAAAPVKDAGVVDVLQPAARPPARTKTLKDCPTGAGAARARRRGQRSESPIGSKRQHLGTTHSQAQLACAGGTRGGARGQQVHCYERAACLIEPEPIGRLPLSQWVRPALNSTSICHKRMSSAASSRTALT
jgi:hypothetical protein